MTPSAAYQPRSLAHSLNRSYADIPAPQLPRSRFDLSTPVFGTFNPGQLVPVYHEEALPSDTFEIRPRFFIRLLTAERPVMDDAYLDWFAFFVPNRLVWDNWQRFMGEQTDPTDSTDFVVPNIYLSEGLPWYFPRYGIADAFGYPVGEENMYPAPPDDPSLPMALPHRGYHLIWNEWFRDQNLQKSFPVPKGDGPDALDASYNGYSYDGLHIRGMRHTYISAALPWPQKGDAVQVPLGLTAPVHGTGGTTEVYWDTPADQSALFINPIAQGGTIAAANLGIYPASAAEPMRFGENVGLEVDLSASTAVTINMLREAIAVQQVLEADARGGTRYVEILRNVFGSISPDFRLQRPEYIGGGSERINMTAVSNTADDTGELTGVAVGGASGSVSYSCVEHGIIYVIANVRARLHFQNKLDRKWTRKTRLEYFRPELAHLGEQAIKNREVFWDDTQDMDEIWGYIGRFDEYRYSSSRIFGQMRSDDPLSLDIWHYGVKYDALPALSSGFIEDPSDETIRRTLKEQELPIVKLQGLVEVHATRILPVYGNPGLNRL